MLVNLPEEVARRLEALAAEQGASVGAVLTDLLNRYTSEPDEQPITNLTDRLPGSLAEMAQNALEAGIQSAQTVD